MFTNTFKHMFMHMFTHITCSFQYMFTPMFTPMFTAICLHPCLHAFYMHVNKHVYTHFHAHVYTCLHLHPCSQACLLKELPHWLTINASLFLPQKVYLNLIPNNYNSIGTRLIEILIFKQKLIYYHFI